MSGAKIVGSVASGFVVAYGVFSVLASQGTKKLPHTINPQWEAATFKMNQSKDRVAAEPILLNPLRQLA